MPYKTYLTPDYVDRLTELYITEEGVVRKIKDQLEIEGFPTSLVRQHLVHPLVLGALKEKMKRLRSVYSKEDHLEKLQEIRDLAMGGEAPQLKTALAAEIAIGRACGFYENLGSTEEEQANRADPKTLSTEELRKRLTHSLPVHPQEPYRTGTDEDEIGF